MGSVLYWYNLTSIGSFVRNDILEREALPGMVFDAGNIHCLKLGKELWLIK